MIFKSYHINEKTNCATRKASELSLEIIATHLDNLIGGSADLTGSNNTKIKEFKPITKDNFSGRYIYYGVREHAMAAIMNGLSLHQGLRPYGGTFFNFYRLLPSFNSFSCHYEVANNLYYDT